jgi:hypothetical protein
MAERIACTVAVLAILIALIRGALRRRSRPMTKEEWRRG